EGGVVREGPAMAQGDSVGNCNSLSRKSGKNWATDCVHGLRARITTDQKGERTKGRPQFARLACHFPFLGSDPSSSVHVVRVRSPWPILAPSSRSVRGAVLFRHCRSSAPVGWSGRQ